MLSSSERKTFMEIVYIIMGFLLQLLRDPALATILAVLSLLLTIHPTKTVPTEKDNKNKPSD